MTKPVPYESYSDDFQPLQVEIDPDNFEDGLRRFKSAVQRSKILTLYKSYQSFEKPSAKKRRIKRERIERQRLADIRDKQIATGEWERRQKKQEAKRKHRSSDEFNE